MISDIQPWLAGLIAAHPKFVTAGIKLDNSIVQAAAQSAGQPVPAAARGIVIEDGTFPKTPGLESALQAPGLAIVIWYVGNVGLIATSKSGVSNVQLYLAIVIQENAAVNRAQGGTGIRAEDAYQYVYQAIAGKRMDGDPLNTNVVPHHEPFDNLGTANGVWSIVGNFTKEFRIGPL
ncbi:MAG TPA: hypothetical protein VFB72_21120 [Verrucomicrobiae bacterium]|nr:hypothetical protein [Verrucomicrobiae bacterium]